MPSAHPMRTVKGTTKGEICIEDPKATAMAKSISSFMATEMAVMYSTTLPTMGKMIR